MALCFTLTTLYILWYNIWVNNKDQIKKSNIFLNLSTKGKVVFALQVLGIFVATFLILYLFGLTPKEINLGFNNSRALFSENEDPGIRTRPEHIVIDKIGLSASIIRPGSQDISILDEALSNGVVHYPGSGTLEIGNIFLFGHSADGYQLVSNEALKVFNGIYKLEEGDQIFLFGNGKKYVYSVDSVNLVDASTALIDFSNNKQTLTISTCNTFGELQERWVVEANLVKTEIS